MVLDNTIFVPTNEEKEENNNIYKIQSCDIKANFPILADSFFDIDSLCILLSLIIEFPNVFNYLIGLPSLNYSR